MRTQSAKRRCSNLEAIARRGMRSLSHPFSETLQFWDRSRNLRTSFRSAEKPPDSERLMLHLWLTTSRFSSFNNKPSTNPSINKSLSPQFLRNNLSNPLSFNRTFRAKNKRPEAERLTLSLRSKHCRFNASFRLNPSQTRLKLLSSRLQ